ncbi:MAG: glycoside hydrolase family 9 protein, partial [Pseudomonadota bacterium]
TPGSTDAILSEGHPWHLVDAETAEVVATGRLVLAKPLNEAHMDGVNFNGCDIYEADFTHVTRTGTYLLQVEGVGASPPFPITHNPYVEVLRLAARWYYHQRSGIEIAAPYGEGRTRPRNGHPEDGLIVEQTDVQLGRTSEGYRSEPYAPRFLGELPVGEENPNAWGGWHDAGDWDRRIQHMNVVHDMALAIELFPTARNLALNLPESGRSFADDAVRARRNDDDRGDGSTVLPDLIHEALWGASLWRRTQAPDGGIIGGVEYSLDGIEGSVSWNPVQRTFAYAPEEWASYRFVLGAAKLGHVITHVCGDAVLGAALIAEAEAAWDWAEAVFAKAQAEGTYNDDDGVAMARARMPASAALFRATGRRDACMVFEALNPYAPTDEVAAAGVRRSDVAMFAIDYLRAGEEGHQITAAIASSITTWLNRAAYANRRLGRDYGLHSTDSYPWGQGWLRFGPGSNWRARRAAYAYALNGSVTMPI